MELVSGVQKEYLILYLVNNMKIKLRIMQEVAKYEANSSEELENTTNAILAIILEVVKEAKGKDKKDDGKYGDYVWDEYIEGWNDRGDEILSNVEEALK